MKLKPLLSLFAVAASAVIGLSTASAHESCVTPAGVALPATIHEDAVVVVETHRHYLHTYYNGYHHRRWHHGHWVYW